MFKRFWSGVILLALLMLVGVNVAQANSVSSTVCQPILAQVEVTPTVGELVSVDATPSADGTVTVVREKMPDWAVWLQAGGFLLIAGLAYYGLYVAQRSQWHISNSIPASSLTDFLKQAGHSAGTAGIELLGERIEQSPMTWDDALWDGLKPRLRELLNDLFAAQAASQLPTDEVREVG